MDVPGIYSINPAQRGFDNLSASSNFIASQWWRPSGDLPDNLTGITFESRDYAKPQITLPPAYKALQAGQTIAIKSATGKRFVQMDSEEIKNNY